MSRTALLLALPLLLTAATARAQSSCSSDGRQPPTALVERFLNADCASCWTAADAARPAPRELAIDWVVPGARGDDAPLAAVARRDALARLESLRRSRPAGAESVRSVRQGPAAGTLRVAHGLAFNGYIGTSIELRRPRPGAWSAWLALVETLPAGTEGSAVERNLVRNLLEVPWPPGAPRLRESRPMNIPDGANPERLRVVGWVQDARGVIRSIAQSVCAPPEPTR
jgi:hypothetical protein